MFEISNNRLSISQRLEMTPPQEFKQTGRTKQPTIFFFLTRFLSFRIGVQILSFNFLDLSSKELRELLQGKIKFLS